VRALGWRRAPHDPRDRNAALKLGPVLALPKEVSLEQHVVEILDQGQLGSCTANATAQAVRIAHHLQGVPNPPLMSRLFNYFCARGWEGTSSEDAGAYIKDNFRTLMHIGFCPESIWPYSDSGDRFKTMPTPQAFHDAYDQRSLDAYHRIIATGADRIQQLQQALLAGHAVVFGTAVSEAFCGNQLASGAELPPIDKQIAGDHALCCMGYWTNPNDGAIWFRIANSWSTGWGDRGYVWFHQEYMTWGPTDDCWFGDVVPPPSMLGSIPAEVRS